MFGMMLEPAVAAWSELPAWCRVVVALVLVALFVFLRVSAERRRWYQLKGRERIGSNDRRDL